MSLIEPEIDSRDYREILNEALARIPVHNPEWTNFNDSDPGITLVQLFAFMTENLLYRSNLIPKRNRIKFLNLLGIPLQASEPARGIVTFSNQGGQTHSLPSDMEVFAKQVPFRTEDGLYVLPVEARIYYKSALPEPRRKTMEELSKRLYASFMKSDVILQPYETRPLEPPASGTVFPVVDLAIPHSEISESESQASSMGSKKADETVKYTVDGSLWVALLVHEKNVLERTREEIANKVLTLGILPEMISAARTLKPEGELSIDPKNNLIFEIPAQDKSWVLPDDPDKREAYYKPLESHYTVNLLSEPGTVQLRLPEKGEDLRLWENIEPLEQGSGDFPPLLEDPHIMDRVITWIRIRPHQQNGTSKQQLRARLSWVGINASRISQRGHIFSETAGVGTGEPDQVVTLVNRPVIPKSVKLTMNGETWHEIDDLMAADPEVPVRSPGLPTGSNPPEVRKEKVNVFTVDRESGEIRFGDGLRGARPPSGAIIRTNYDYGGGSRGMVGIGTVNKSPLLPAGLRVINPLPTWGGIEAESVEDAEKRISGYLQHRNRLVSKIDFEEITRNIPGVEISRVEVMPLVHPDIPDGHSQGVVTVMVIPRHDPVQPDAPLPDQLFIDTVCKYLDPKRLVTTEVHVCGPTYVPVWVSVGIEVIEGMDLSLVKENVKKDIGIFLSPIQGGFDKKGWPMEKVVEAMELLTVSTRVKGVSKVNKVLLMDGKGSKTESIPMKKLQMPRLVRLAVREGQPQEPEELQGLPLAIRPVPGEPGQVLKPFPVPVVSPGYKC
jgi:hypothetical protein